MSKIRRFTPIISLKMSTLVILILIGNIIYGQSFFDSKSFYITGSYGFCKIPFYHDYTPTYILAADQEAVEYSPSWMIKIEKSFWVNDRIDFSIGLSHLTITERTNQTAKPDWFPPSEKFLSQGFFHIVTALKMQLPDDRFTPRIGIGTGIINFINNDVRESSNAAGGLDFNLQIGTSVKLNKRWLLEGEWIWGLTKYDFLIGTPVNSRIFFKYHTFQIGITYILHENDPN